MEFFPHKFHISFDDNCNSIIEFEDHIKSKEFMKFFNNNLVLNGRMINLEWF